MRGLRRLKLALAAGVALATPTLSLPATAGDWSMGIEIDFDRQPGDFAEPKDTKVTVSLSRTLPSGIVLGSSLQNQVNVKGEVSYQVEGTLGYSWKIGRF